MEFDHARVSAWSFPNSKYQIDSLEAIERCVANLGIPKMWDEV
jgi:hypothetical protein